MMGSFSSYIGDCSSCGLQTLVSWKDARITPDAMASQGTQSEDQETELSVNNPVDVEGEISNGEITNGQESCKDSDVNDPANST